MRSYTYFLIILLTFYFKVAVSQTDTLDVNKRDTVVTTSSDTMLTIPAYSVSTDIPQSPQEKRDGEIYKLKPAVDIPLVLICGGWSGFAFTKIYNKDASSEEDIINLDKNDVPEFDRWAAGNSDEKADMVSDYLFYGSIPYAFTLLLSKEIRHDGGKIGLLYLEAMSITGLFYTGSVYVIDRYRPETYNTDLPVSERTTGNNKNAFIGGHPALVATSTFFTASVFSNYHPESPLKYVAYGVAIAATGTTAYLRHKAGKHFPSDLLAGMTVGTLSGLLVPKFHKNRDLKDQKLGLYPFGYDGVKGLTAIYKF